MFVCRRDGLLRVCTIDCEYRNTCEQPRLSLLIYTTHFSCVSPKADGDGVIKFNVIELNHESYINDAIVNHERLSESIMQLSRL